VLSKGEGKEQTTYAMSYFLGIFTSLREKKSKAIPVTGRGGL
jgi:hypothetical protein